MSAPNVLIGEPVMFDYAHHDSVFIEGSEFRPDSR